MGIGLSGSEQGRVVVASRTSFAGCARCSKARQPLGRPTT
jgi:hypothetical protein